MKYEQPALLRESKKAPLRIDHVAKTIKTASTKMLDAFVDSIFEFADQPLPSQVPYISRTVLVHK